MATVAYKQRISLLIELIIFTGATVHEAYLPGHLTDLFRIHNIASVFRELTPATEETCHKLLCSVPSIPRTT